MRPVLLIDNYDSFTWNLAQHLGALGAAVEVVRNDETDPARIEAGEPAAIVISPGPCTPAEAGVSVEVVRRFGASVPVLGVCLGHQCIGAAFGGRVVRAALVMHGKTSTFSHDGRGVFEGLPNPLTATRYHSLVVEPGSLPAELEVAASTEDGVIMGLRHRRFPVHGVQFHPESVMTPEGQQLLGNFLALAAQPVAR
ncbi:MAG: anthranilate synthase component II [Candidatus Dormibacteria bacterium]